MNDDSRRYERPYLWSVTAVALTLTFHVELVSAANIACGDTIIQDTVLDADITNCPGTGIEIRTDAITLDCAGFAITGLGAGNGVLVRAHNVTIKNCQIHGFFYGINVAGAGGLYLENTFSANSTGAIIQGPSISWVRNTANDNVNNGFHTIRTATENIFSENVADRNGRNGFAIGGDDAEISGNKAKANGQNGFALVGADRTLVDGNIANSNGDHGIYLQTASNNTVSGNRAERNAKQGFMLQSASTGNTISGNQALGCNRGFVVASVHDANNTITDNLAQGNLIGISIAGAQFVAGNTVRSNRLIGIQLSGAEGTVVDGNRIEDTSPVFIPGVRAGMYLSGGSNNNSIVNNILLDNSTTGIVLRNANTGNEFHNNTIVTSLFGITLNGPGELDNTFANNFLHNDTNVSVPSGPFNTWNTAKLAGTNIVGGSFFGGNFFSKPDGTGFSETCPDVDEDDICDTPYMISDGNTDNFPLVAIGTRPTPGPPKLAWSRFSAGGGFAVSSVGSVRLDSTLGQFSGNSAGFWRAIRCFEDFDGLSRAQEAQLGTNICAFDTDNDSLGDGEDGCPLEPGRVSWNGCPAGDKNIVTLQVIDEKALSGACPDGSVSCDLPLEGAAVKVFDRNVLNGLEITLLVNDRDDGDAEGGEDRVTLCHIPPGNPDQAHTIVVGEAAVSAHLKHGDLLGPCPARLTMNPRPSFYDDIYESPEANEVALASRFGCTTGANGICLIGEDEAGNYLVVVKYVDDATGKAVYTGKPKNPEDFVVVEGDPPLVRATLEFRIIKLIDKDGTVHYCGEPAVDEESEDCEKVRDALDDLDDTQRCRTKQPGHRGCHQDRRRTD